jgi:hypothetical protein
MTNQQGEVMIETYTVHLTFSVDDEADEHLKTSQAVEAEIITWLESLKARVERLSVTKGKS